MGTTDANSTAGEEKLPRRQTTHCRGAVGCAVPQFIIQKQRRVALRSREGGCVWMHTLHKAHTHLPWACVDVCGCAPAPWCVRGGYVAARQSNRTAGCTCVDEPDAAPDPSSLPVGRHARGIFRTAGDEQSVSAAGMARRSCAAGQAADPGRPWGRAADRRRCEPETAHLRNGGNRYLHTYADTRARIAIAPPPLTANVAQRGRRSAPFPLFPLAMCTSRPGGGGGLEGGEEKRQLCMYPVLTGCGRNGEWTARREENGVSISLAGPRSAMGVHTYVCMYTCTLQTCFPRANGMPVVCGRTGRELGRTQRPWLRASSCVRGCRAEGITAARGSRGYRTGRVPGLPAANGTAPSRAWDRQPCRPAAVVPREEHLRTCTAITRPDRGCE